MGREIILNVRNFSFKNILKNLSFEIRKGDIFAVMGHNGAGKTTLFKCILGFYKTNFNFLKDNLKIGYLPEEINFPSYLKVKDIIKMAQSFDRQESRLNLELFNFSNFGNRKVSTLSKGERKKIALYLTFYHNPEVIFLDEPTDGLDPVLRFKFKNFLKELAESGKTIVISSHVLTELEEVATSYMILKKGKIIKKDFNSLDSLEGNFIVKPKDMDVAKKQLANINNLDFEEDYILVKNKEVLIEVIKTMIDNDNLIEVENERLSFEKLYMDSETNQV